MVYVKVWKKWTLQQQVVASYGAPKVAVKEIVNQHFIHWKMEMSFQNFSLGKGDVKFESFGCTNYCNWIIWVHWFKKFSLGKGDIKNGESPFTEFQSFGCTNWTIFDQIWTILCILGAPFKNMLYFLNQWINVQNVKRYFHSHGNWKDT